MTNQKNENPGEAHYGYITGDIQIPPPLKDVKIKPRSKNWKNRKLEKIKTRPPKMRKMGKIKPRPHQPAAGEFFLGFKGKNDDFVKKRVSRGPKFQPIF